MADSTTGTPYHLRRDALASLRLNAQHYYWWSVTETLLHPDVRLSLDNPVIADIGTGTGIWALDLSRKVPHALIDGFDISTDQFPIEEDLPANVRMHGDFDIFKPVPEHLKARYDVVHVRFLLSVVRSEDVALLSHRFLEMLKPGGFLQWTESNAPKLTIIRPKTMSALEKTPGMDWLLSFVHAAGGPQAGNSIDWMMALSESLEKAGFVDAKQDVIIESRPGFRKFRTQNVLLTCNEWIQMLEWKGKPGEAQRMSEFHDKAMQELKKGVGVQWPTVVAIGRKPT